MSNGHDSPRTFYGTGAGRTGGGGKAELSMFQTVQSGIHLFRCYAGILEAAVAFPAFILALTR